MENPPIDQAFASVDEAYEFLKREQADQGFVISKSKSYRDRKDPKIQGRTIIQCQQSGPCRAFKVQKGKYMASTKKTNCPFNAIIKFNGFFNTSHITITDATHNHNAIEFPLGSSRLRRLHLARNALLKWSKIEASVDNLHQKKLPAKFALNILKF